MAACLKHESETVQILVPIRAAHKKTLREWARILLQIEVRKNEQYQFRSFPRNMKLREVVEAVGFNADKTMAHEWLGKQLRTKCELPIGEIESTIITDILENAMIASM